MRKFGLIGKNIAYSFSKDFFTKKFKNEAIHNTTYENFDLNDISEFQSLVNTQENICGLNVTIPYKESVLPFLTKVTKKAQKIGAVNTIKITPNKQLIGYNTDYYGFKKSLQPFLQEQHTHALILGTGGASKAIAYALKKLNIKYKFVSRNTSKENTLTYKKLTKKHLQKHLLIINCTPLGTYPNTQEKPEIPYQHLTQQHILYDLVYNPPLSQFLLHGKEKGALVINGRRMLELQAKKAWKIWNSLL